MLVLSDKNFKILNLIEKSRSISDLRKKCLAIGITHSPGYMSKKIAAFEERNLIEKTKKGRIKLLSLTEAGRYFLGFYHKHGKKKKLN